MNAPKIFVWASFCLSILVFSGNSLADTTVLRPVADAVLWEVNPDNNVGKNPDIGVGAVSAAGQGKRGRGLFMFDTSKIPTNATVTSAKLIVRVVKVPSPKVDANFDLRKVLASWGEGVKSSTTGAPATAGEVTWKARFAGGAGRVATNWSVAGGAFGTDFANVVSATTQLRGVANYTFASTPQMVADVQSWVQNTNSNFGWVMICQAEGTQRTAKRIATREAAADTATITNRPLLEVVYTVPSAQPPAITTQPISQNVAQGGTLTLSVAATGSAPLTYQWQHANTNLLGATFTNLTLQNFQPADAGDYKVVVSNSAGSVTSAVATVGLVMAPSITSVNAAAGTFNFSFQAQSGNAYTVESKTNLAPAVPWQTVTNINSKTSSSAQTVSESIAAPSKFYRIQATPAK
jgi:hypothetical protein